MKNIAVYHKDCDDGSMSAAVARRFMPEAVLFATTYGHEWKEFEDIENGDTIYFIDFSPDPDYIMELHENRSIDFIILDHHASAVEKFERFCEQNPDKRETLMGRSYFDQKKCGSTLAWDYFYKGNRARPRVLEYIEIADTWTWDRDENSKYVTQYVRTITTLGDIDAMAKLLEDFDYEEAVEKGQLLYKRLINDAKTYAERAKPLTINGHKVLAVNSIHAQSEIGHMLASKASNHVGACYTIYHKDRMVKFSFRGSEGNLAREIAESVGGGGHDLASGATVSLEQFQTFL